MATIYTSLDENKNKTFFLITFFIIIVIGLGYLLSWYFQSQWILYAAVIIAVVQSFASYWWSDEIVLSMTHAQPVAKENYPVLYNIVENLCLTAGLPMPAIYILPESQPNAFATGRDKNHSALAVTQGLIDKLEKTELEGVIAHELSHIGNQDVLLQSVVVVLVSVIALVAQLSMRVSFQSRGSRGSRDNGGGIITLIFVLLTLILAPLAATLLQLAISRKREYLADASAALLTRYPEGLASALEKIASDRQPMQFANSSTAHLYISDPLGKGRPSLFQKLFSTHPPVEDRVARLRRI